MLKAAPFQQVVKPLREIIGIVVCIVIVLAALPASTRAATEDYTHPGPYVGLGVAGGLEKFNGGRGSAFGDSAGLTLRGGYRLAPYFAVEGLYEYMDDFGLKATTLGGIKVHEDLRTHNFSLMGKGILPFGPFQPYLTGGVGFLNTENTVKIRRQEVHNNGSSTEFAGRVGAGIDLVTTSHLAFTLDSGYVLPTHRLADLNYISFGMGVRYTF